MTMSQVGDDFSESQSK